jgi:hypothetical protein
MRLLPTFALLITALAGCGGSITIVLKSPVESKCKSAGLKGCPDLTKGVLVYVEGQKDEGKDLLIRGSAENSPAKVKKFAKMIRELKQIPGASRYAGPLFEVADILASAKGAAKGGPAQGGAEEGEEPAEGAPLPPNAGPREGGTVALASTSDRAPCGGVGAGFGYCAVIATGPLTLTELTVGAGCPGELVVASVKARGSVEVPRWVARNPHGAADARATVNPREILVVGVQASAANDPRCSLTWAGYRPTTGA